MEERLLTLGNQMAAGGRGERGEAKDRESRTEEKIRNKVEDGVEERSGEQTSSGGRKT